MDYPGIGPLHAHLFETKRAQFIYVTDEEAMNAGIELSRTEGIIPALESAHAIAVLNKMNFKQDDIVVINLSGRGDKDMAQYAERINQTGDINLIDGHTTHRDRSHVLDAHSCMNIFFG